MSKEGRLNTALALAVGTKAAQNVGQVVQQAIADGHIDKSEALGIFFSFLATALTEGLKVAAQVAMDEATRGD